jgi:uncharacterized membrane protein YbhN (UPF0104 family)
MAVAAAFLTIPSLTGVPARLIDGCGKWIAAAGAFELLSALGFVVFFKLVFGAGIKWVDGAPAALRALGATTILPAGGLIGPTIGAWSTGAKRPSLSQLTRSTVAFVILNNAPNAILLGVVGIVLWFGLVAGPHSVTLTVLPALLALCLVAGAWLAGGPSNRASSTRPGARSRVLVKPVIALSDGAKEARRLVSAGDWKLVGPVAYYAFDNAVLWAAFHAYGRTPPVAVIVMGYLVGSLAGTVPLPAGLGAVEGGMIGALVLYGAPAAPAAAAVLLYRGISLSVPVVLAAIGCARIPSGEKSLPGGKQPASRARAAVARRRRARGLAPAPID